MELKQVIPKTIYEYGISLLVTSQLHNVIHEGISHIGCSNRIT